ncbi:TraM recognition domain-containing protein [Niveispirillum sp. SYP-B3756]|uniref:TraM recognition domain-containing protein n=1 Tax=Niveispirillum sp. SYP-B3756 TaxID=2662178 RepID=UPI00129223FE|nr:TraM recognition domain-containing protein [Niveispirillum sp. SYP-B3756]MQP68166.1 TraM recognition domain-containing protein [Niveispirillum sp. SYP-B3756]
MRITFRAPDSKYERRIERQLRDTRPVLVQVGEALSDPMAAAVGLIGLAMVAIFFPAASDLALLLGLLGMLWSMTRPYGLPLHMPQWSGAKDPNDVHPGTMRPVKAKGIIYFGNEVGSSAQVMATNDYLRQHQMTLGTTGSGKTEFLKAKATNTLCWGSGFILIDGKADNKLYGDILTIARRFGRDDSVLVMNYMTGSSDAGSTSNTMNPFAEGSSSALNELLVSLMDESSGDGMWKGRAIALSSSIMTAVVWLRDNQAGYNLNVETISDALVLKNVVKLSRDKALPAHIRVPLMDYLKSVPGYKDESFNDNGSERTDPNAKGGPDKGLATCREQHGYLQMQFTRVLNDLANTYGYIFKTRAGEIDMYDVVVNRRILVVLMPSLEKSPESLAGLGKIVVATLKNVMAKCLGSAIEGEWAEIIENKVTNSASPALAMFDEVGYYATNGMAMMAAQARGLGFSIDFAAQDEAAMKRRIKEEVDSIKGNANLKFFLRLEDTGDTKRTFEEGAGEMDITKVRGFDDDGAGLGYRAQSGAGLERVRRGTFLDLKGQPLGFAHLMVGDKIIRMRVANIDHGKLKYLRVNRFMAVELPKAAEIQERNLAGAIHQRLTTKGFKVADHVGPFAASPEITDMAATLATLKAAGIRVASTERGIVALASLHVPLRTRATLAAVAVTTVENAITGPATGVIDPSNLIPTPINPEINLVIDLVDMPDDGLIEGEAGHAALAPPEGSDQEDLVAERVQRAQADQADTEMQDMLVRAFADLYGQIHERGILGPLPPATDSFPPTAAGSNDDMSAIAFITGVGDPSFSQAVFGGEDGRAAVAVGISAMEMMTGASRDEATVVAGALLDAAEQATIYPSKPTPAPLPKADLKSALNVLRTALAAKQGEGRNSG